MKRRNLREREEADAHERAEARREALLAELRARQGAAPPAAGEEPAEETVTSGESAGDEGNEADEAPAPEPE